MQTRAKFRVTSITHTENWTGSKENGPLAQVKLNAVYDSNPESENGKFFAATPSGGIDLGIINPDAAKQFEVGSEYYVSFEKAS